MPKTGLVIGGGIAGIQAALDLADQGFTIYLVEKNPNIGGKMAQLDKTFPALDCAACTMTDKMVAAVRHPNIRLLTYSEVKEVKRVGKTFKVKILKKPRFVDEKRCIGCGVCARFCPVEVPNEFDEGIGVRNAIYSSFPQAVPQIYTIDREHCLECELCKNVCVTGAVDLQQRPDEIEIQVGAIIVATGFNLFDARRKKEFGYGLYDNVITSLALERLLSNAGPTGGRVVRLSDGKIPKRIAFIQCVGFQDEKTCNAYCSNICCMNAAKQAELMKKRLPGVNVTIYYTDTLVFGNGYEEFYRKAKSEFDIRFVKAKVDEIQEKASNSNLVIRAESVIDGGFIENEFEMVVLSTGLMPAATSDFSKILQLRTGDNNFFAVANPKIDLVTTNIEGIFVAGVAEGPKDINESVRQANAAAMKASALLKDQI